VTKKLLDHGAKVVGLGRSNTPPPELSGQIDWIGSPLELSPIIRNEIAHSDIIFNFVGATIPDTIRKSSVNNITEYVLPHVELIDYISRFHDKRVVFASSGGTIYGPNATSPIHEDAPKTPISEYGLNKLTIEQYLSYYNFKRNLDYTTLRVSNPYGPNQSPFKSQGVVAHMLYRAQQGMPLELWGTGDAVRDFVYIDDVATAFCLAGLYSGGERVFNIGSMTGRSVKSVINDIAQLPGIPKVTVVRKPGQDADVPVNVLNTERAFQHLAWKPVVDWHDGLLETLKWIKAKAAAFEAG
jgi:UDP-glucose 4-epimerase